MTGTTARPGSEDVGPIVPSLQQTEWPAMFSVSAYGVRIGVRLGEPAAFGDLARHLPPGSTCEEFCGNGRVYSLAVEPGDGSGRPRNAVYVDGTLLSRCATREGALRVFESHLQLHVAEMAPAHVFVHAGVVGYQGRGILLPGRSFAGKSTLVDELVRAGAEYYSDEYAVLDSLGLVHPYARPISIRQKPGSAGVAKQPVPPAGRVGTMPLPVGLVLLCKFRREAKWEPRSLSPGRGALALLANTVCARRVPDVALATLQRVVMHAPVLASDRGEASEVVNSILALAVDRQE